MDAHSSHMEIEKEGAERTMEEKAIAAQRAADLEHLINNTHPSLRDSIYLGDISNGSCHSVSDYSSQILFAQIEVLKETIQDLRQEIQRIKDESFLNKTDLEALRLRLVPEATPETPLNEIFAAVPGIGAKAEEFAPAPAEAPAEKV